MTAGPYAWATHAPADYVLVFAEDPEGEHARVRAGFQGRDQAWAAGRGLEGVEVGDSELHVYCTLSGEADKVLAHLGGVPTQDPCVEKGTIAFVGASGGPGAGSESARRRRHVTACVVFSYGGDAPRCYRLDDQCNACGEFRGKINVLPRSGMYLDTRQLSCRCDSIPCRYCEEGNVRRPLSEHFDPERRAGCMPWFGYLIPCGHCQAAGRGPEVVMSI